MRHLRRNLRFALLAVTIAVLLGGTVPRGGPLPLIPDNPDPRLHTQSVPGRSRPGARLVASDPDASSQTSSGPIGASTPAAPGGARSAGSSSAPANPMRYWVSLTGDAQPALITSPSPGGLEVTTLSRGPVNVFTASGTAASGRTPAAPGRIYVADVSVRTATTARTVAMWLAFYDAQSERLTTVSGQTTKDASTWGAMPHVAGLAPPGTTSLVYGVVFYGTVRGERHQIAEPAVSVFSGSSRALAAPLHTTKTTIVDANGARVMLQGLHRIGFESNRKNFPREAEIAQAKAWGSNVVRVSVAESLWLNTCTSDKPTNDPYYPQKLDYVVHSITSRGMLALIDLHTSVTHTCGASDMQAMADAKYAISFWQQVAARYKSNRLVAFDLYNEPRGISSSTWLSGGTVTWAGTTYAAAGMQELYDAVRAQGATNLVFASGIETATRPPRYPINGSNIVYALHDYTCGTAPPPHCDAPSPYNAKRIIDQWTSFAQSHPVAITEFGWPDAQNGVFSAKVITAAEKLGWGWIAFGWDGGLYGTFSLVRTFTPVYEPSPAGIPILIGLAKN